MGTFGDIIKKLREAAKMEVGEEETTRVRITIADGKVETEIEVIPDLDVLSLEQLYALQEEYEDQLNELRDAEPDEEEDPDEYADWEKAVDKLEQDFEEINDKIEELEEAAEEDEEDE